MFRPTLPKPAIKIGVACPTGSVKGTGASPLVSGSWSRGLNAGLTALVDILRSQNVQLMMVFSPQNSLAASLVTVFFMVAAGFLAGITPALRAMRLDIVDSLRYE